MPSRSSWTSSGLRPLRRQAPPSPDGSRRQVNRISRDRALVTRSSPRPRLGIYSAGQAGLAAAIAAAPVVASRIWICRTCLICPMSICKGSRMPPGVDCRAQAMPSPACLISLAASLTRSTTIATADLLLQADRFRRGYNFVCHSSSHAGATAVEPGKSFAWSIPAGNHRMRNPDGPLTDLPIQVLSCHSERPQVLRRKLFACLMPLEISTSPATRDLPFDTSLLTTIPHAIPGSDPSRTDFGFRSGQSSSRTASPWDPSRGRSHPECRDRFRRGPVW